MTEDAMKNGDLTINLLAADGAGFLHITYTPEAANRLILDSQSMDCDASSDSTFTDN
jgi:hypothetical protein